MLAYRPNVCLLAHTQAAPVFLAEGLFFVSTSKEPTQVTPAAQNGTLSVRMGETNPSPASGTGDPHYLNGMHTFLVEWTMGFSLL